MIELDELELVVVMDNEADTLSSTDNTVQLSESGSLLDRLEPTLEVDGDAYTTVFDQLCCACHGFSAVATGSRHGHTRTVLFDVGPYGEVWLDNAARLGIDLAAIEAIFLSHWHWDHSGGLVAVITEIAAARAAAGHPAPLLDLHPRRPEQRGQESGDGRFKLLPPDPTFEELETAGADLVFFDADHEIADGFFHGSGEIPRLTSFETGFAGHRTTRNGSFTPDPLITDERFLAAFVTGRGVSVLSACSHAGIVNVTNAALLASGGADVDLILGGYHLAGTAMEARIPATVEALLGLHPQLIGPGHCTGWRAKAALANAFAPTNRHAPSAVGTRYRLATV